MYGHAGEHYGNTIELKRFNHDSNNGTVVHECVHHLRQVDRERSSPLTKAVDPKQIKYTGRSTRPGRVAQYKVEEASNIEESCTVAETMARAKKDYITGYYSSVQVYDPKTKRYRKPTVPEARQMAAQDRKLFTNGTGKPLTGDAAVRSVEQHWAKSHIARLKTSRKMAINTVAQNYPETGIKPLSNAASRTRSRQAAKPSAVRAVKPRTINETYAGTSRPLTKRPAAAERPHRARGLFQKKR